MRPPFAPLALDRVAAAHPHIAALRDAVQAAEAARADLEWADDYCMTSGSWDRANRRVLEATRALNAALLAQIEQQAAQITAQGEAVAADLRRIEAIARDAMATP